MFVWCGVFYLRSWMFVRCRVFFYRGSRMFVKLFEIVDVC